MPTTSVANSSGATMVRIRRRKIWLRTRSSTATSGKSWPTSAPTTIDDQNPGGQRPAARDEDDERSDREPAEDQEVHG